GAVDFQTVARSGPSATLPCTVKCPSSHAVKSADSESQCGKSKARDVAEGWTIVVSTFSAPGVVASSRCGTTIAGATFIHLPKVNSMGCSPGTLHGLEALIGSDVPIGGRILDIGSQDISASTAGHLQPIMSKLHGDRAKALIRQRFREGERWKATDL